MFKCTLSSYINTAEGKFLLVRLCHWILVFFSAAPNLPEPSSPLTSTQCIRSVQDKWCWLWLLLSKNWWKTALMQGPPTLVHIGAHGVIPGFSAFFNCATMFLVLYLIVVLDIRLKECGAELVEVSDNGKGVEEANFEGLSKCQPRLSLAIYSNSA